jgi:hypothetical protein
VGEFLLGSKRELSLKRIGTQRIQKREKPGATIGSVGSKPRNLPPAKRGLSAERSSQGRDDVCGGGGAGIGHVRW